MSDVLSGAYISALKNVEIEVGPQITYVVQLTIESKHRLAMFEQRVNQYKMLRKQDKKELIALMTEEISSSIAAMCGVLGKGFKKDIMPVVERVVEEATQAKNLQ